jgi:hypothetical protein
MPLQFTSNMIETGDGNNDASGRVSKKNGVQTGIDLNFCG